MIETMYVALQVPSKYMSGLRFDILAWVNRLNNVKSSIYVIWRRGWDSNPRARFPELRAFQARLFGHSSTSPVEVVISYKLLCIPLPFLMSYCYYGGEGGIRTHDTCKGIPLFESGAFNHSATSPCFSIHFLTKLKIPASWPWKRHYLI